MTARPTPDRPTETQRRLAAYFAFLDAVVPESRYYQGEREDAERVQFLAEAVRDPSTVLNRGDEQGE